MEVRIAIGSSRHSYIMAPGFRTDHRRRQMYDANVVRRCFSDLPILLVKIHGTEANISTNSLKPVYILGKILDDK